jgi:hypothetical protein
MQAKNTINKGDAFHDAIQTLVLKYKVDGVWNGSVESDRSVKGFDIKMSEATFAKVFGVHNMGGRVRLAWCNANITEVKTGNLDLSAVFDDVDILVHGREDKDGNLYCIIVRKNDILSYVSQYGRAIEKKGTTQFQLNVPAPLPNMGSKKWNDLCSYGDVVPMVGKVERKVTKTLVKVNKAGRKDASLNTSNPNDNVRKDGAYWAR